MLPKPVASPLVLAPLARLTPVPSEDLTLQEPPSLWLNTAVLVKLLLRKSIIFIRRFSKTNTGHLPNHFYLEKEWITAYLKRPRMDWLNWRSLATSTLKIAGLDSLSFEGWHSCSENNKGKVSVC